MFVRRWGLQPVFAPENDQGHEADPPGDDEDFSLDDPPEDDDEDLGDDEGEDTQPGDADQGDDPPARQPSRGENRVAQATREAKEARERAEAADRRVQELERRLSTPPESAEQRRARLEAMDPWDRAEVLRQESENRTQQQLQAIRLENWERSDKAEYDSLAARLPAAAKLRDEVEKTFEREKQQGRYVDRKTLLKFIIGERALDNAGRATGRAKKAAEGNRQRQTSRPGNGRGDLPSDRSDRGARGDTPEARERRLLDVLI